MARPQSIVEFDRRMYRMSDLPDEIAIEPIMGCNLRCLMCPVTDAPVAMNGRTPVVMKLDVYRRVLAEIADRPRSVLLTILGEPLLHPKIVEFVKLAKGDGHHVGLITNGTRLTTPLATRLIDAGLNVLIMSVDGLTKRTYEALRVGARHEMVFSNLRELIRQNAERGTPLRIEINYIVSSRTEPEQDDFFREFSPLVACINFNPIADFGGQFLPPDALLTENGDPRAISSRLAAAPRLPCIHLWRGMFVSAEGRLMLCCNDFKLESALPSLTERPLRQIWGSEMEQHRRSHVNGSFKSEPCRSCRVNAVTVRVPAEVKRRILNRERMSRIRRAILPTALVSKRRREQRRIADLPFGVLDFPLPDSTLRGAVAVRGWALGCRGRTIQRVAIRIDRTEMGTADWGYYRPDVGETYPGRERSFSGFDYTLDTRHLSNGAHVLDISVTDTASETATLGTRSLIVQN
jgi:radical SAM protein with 4Fe4S-binding SPASM domain